MSPNAGAKRRKDVRVFREMKEKKKRERDSKLLFMLTEDKTVLHIINLL